MSTVWSWWPHTPPHAELSFSTLGSPNTKDPGPLPVLQHFPKCLGASVRLLQGQLFDLFPLLLLLLQIWSVTLPATFPFCKILTRNPIGPVIPEFLHTFSLRREHAGVSYYNAESSHAHLCQGALFLLFIASVSVLSLYLMCLTENPDLIRDPTFVIQESITSMSISQRILKAYN